MRGARLKAECYMNEALIVEAGFACLMSVGYFGLEETKMVAGPNPAT
jgi:hypothetical protein